MFCYYRPRSRCLYGGPQFRERIRGGIIGEAGGALLATPRQTHMSAEQA